jgi:hypothetical protein
LDRTDGNALIVVDEIQSIIPGVLEVLAPALDDTFPGFARQELEIYTNIPFPQTRYIPIHTGKEAEVCDENGYCHSDDSSQHQRPSSSPSNSPSFLPSSFSSATSSLSSLLGSTMTTKEVVRRHSTGKAIFLFISDIGVDSMTNLLMKAGDRSSISTYELRNEIKKCLDKQWERLNFGKSINEVIPYLPLEPQHIEAIFFSKIHKFATKYQLNKWLSLEIEEDVILYLTSSDFIGYNKSSKAVSDNITGNNKKVVKLFARHGARSLEKGGPLQDLESLLYSFKRPGMNNSCELYIFFTLTILFCPCSSYLLLSLSVAVLRSYSSYWYDNIRDF